MITADDIIIAASRGHLLSYSRYIQPNLVIMPFHKVLYEVLDRFAHGKIKKLMITMQPQVGKSEASSRKLPSFCFGIDPDKRIAIASYAQYFAEDFNRDNQKIIDSPEYKKLFPKVRLRSDSKADSLFQRNAEVFDIVGHSGFLKVVGRGKGITGKTIDMFIMDDLYKDYAEGNSPTVRDEAWNWYTSAVDSRLHNNSQQLILFTRWSEDDLIGRLEGLEEVIDAKSWSDFDNIPNGAWIKLNFPAIQDRDPTELDPRQKGDVLWEDRHSYDRLIAKRKLDPVQFDCLYQGQPESSEGLLYGREWKTYKSVEDYGIVVGKGNYTDTADKGADNLCSISYDLVKGKDIDGMRCYYLLVTDVLLSDKPIEETSVMLPMMLNRSGTRYCNIESNNGGHGFALLIRPKVKCKVNWFHQNENKESRIMTNVAGVKTHIIMPYDWETRFPELYSQVIHYKRTFESNKHDDVPDVLTGMYETEILKSTKNKGLTYHN